MRRYRNFGNGALRASRRNYGDASGLSFPSHLAGEGQGEGGLLAHLRVTPHPFLPRQGGGT